MNSLMTCLQRYRAILPLLVATALFSAIADAQTACNGKALYTATIVSGQLTCANGACHGPSPAANQNKLRNGENNGPVIGAAISNVAEMRFLAGKLATAQLADLGAYIATPTVTCTAAAPIASLSSTSLAFASTNVGATAATQVATLTNTGTAALVIASTALSGADFAIASTTCTAGLSVAVGGSCTVTARFTPTAAGARTGSITINHNASPATSTVSLSGTGVAVVVTAPAATLSASSLTFSSTNVGTAAATQVVTLTNSGTAALVIASATLSGADFAIASNTCTAGLSIAVGGTCAVTVRFTPTAAGARTGSISISHNANPASNAVALSGTGVAVVVGAPAATLSGTSLTFTSTAVGATSAAQSITLSNTGTAALTLGATAITGNFLTLANNCTSGTSIAVGGNCSITVAFSPLSVGALSGSITIAHNATPASSNVSLSGTGAPGVVPGAPVATASASSVTFPSINVGTASAGQLWTLTNTGSANLTISAMAVSNPEFSATINSCTVGATVTPGASCMLTVAFTPSATGARSAILSISHNASPSTTAVSLVGTGVIPTISLPVAQLNETALLLPATGLGAVAPGFAVTLSNTGNAPLVLGGLFASPSEFRVASTNCSAGTSLSPGAHCTAIVTFAPAAIGDKTGSVTFNHNAQPNSTTLPVSASGMAAPTTTPVTRLMVEYLYTPLNYYFITSRDSDKTLLDGVATFQPTGATFPVYATQQGEMRGITRFYFDQVAKNKQRGSHYYALLDADLLALADQNPGRSKAAGMAQNKGLDSFAYLPVVPGVGGSCSAGLLPVYRLFRGNANFPDDPNHRFTTSLTTYNDAITAGWDGEGVNFCVPAQ